MRGIVQIALAFAAAAGLAGVVHAGSTVGAEKMDAVSDKSGHTTVPMAPNVAKTPTPGGPVPIPYPNLGQGDSDSQKNKTPKSTVLKSTGDEAGTVKEVILLTPLDHNTPPDAAARQTPKTDFGSVLGQGGGKAADAALDTPAAKAPKRPLEPVKQPVVTAPKNPVDAPPQPLPVKLGPPVGIAPPPQVTPPVAAPPVTVPVVGAPPVPIPVPVTPPANVPQPVLPQPVLRR